MSLHFAFMCWRAVKQSIERKPFLLPSLASSQSLSQCSLLSSQTKFSNFIPPWSLLLRTVSSPHIPPKNTPTIVLSSFSLVSEDEVSRIISHSYLSVNKPPSVIAAWQALCRHSKSPHWSSFTMVSGAIIIIIINLSINQSINQFSTAQQRHIAECRAIPVWSWRLCSNCRGCPCFAATFLCQRSLIVHLVYLLWVGLGWVEAGQGLLDGHRKTFSSFSFLLSVVYTSNLTVLP